MAANYWGGRRRAALFLGRLARRGWLQRLAGGLYLIVPLDAGPQRAWTEDLLAIIPQLVQPAAIAYWSALSYWGLTEHFPSTTFVQTTKRKRAVTVLGMPVRFVTVSPERFFGLVQRTRNGRPVQITDREKTLLDAASRPDLSGGAGLLAQALGTAAPDLDWDKLDSYLERWRGGEAVKRLGYLIQVSGLQMPDGEERLSRWKTLVTRGVIQLEPGAPPVGPVMGSWGIRDNLGAARFRGRRNDS